MKKIIINRDDLKEEDMSEVVRKAKVLFINSKNEIMLGYSNHYYQFPGGTVEIGEDLLDTVNREIKEETGIELHNNDLKPFACSFGYYKDWPELGKNRKVEIYYYEIKTNEHPNLQNTEYTESEKEGHFELRYIPLDEVENELIENANKYDDDKGIVQEMLELFKIYKNS
ncbi:MAG: NUDIX hydrolase [Bacilli bacterium]|nr:NUDIX hydrolase [Bacilli bacterium]